MKIYGVDVAEGSKITNATIANGTEFPSNPNEGELFWRSDQNKLYVYDEGTATWLSTSTQAFPLLAPDGSYSAPSYSFADDTDTGIYSSDANTLCFSTEGAERVVITGIGVGVGSAPSAIGSSVKTIHVAGSNGAGIRLEDTTTHPMTGYVFVNNNKLYIETGGAQDIYLNPNGTTRAIISDEGLGVGITPSYRIHAADTQIGTSGIPYWSYWLQTTVDPPGTTNGGHVGLISNVSSTGTQTLANNLTGLEGKVTHGGTGTLYLARGIMGGVQANDQSGAISHAYSFHALPPSVFGTGSVGTAYGLFINPQKTTGVTTGYGVYQNGSADTNYFAGYVGIGVVPPLAPLHVNTSGSTIATFETTGTGGVLQIKDSNGVAEISTLSDGLALYSNTTKSTTNLVWLDNNTTNGTILQLQGDGTSNVGQCVLYENETGAYWVISHRSHDLADFPNYFGISHYSGNTGSPPAPNWTGRIEISPNGTIEAEDGSASAPTYSFISDPDTGIYNISGNNLGIATGGVLCVQIDDVGKAHFSKSVEVSRGDGTPSAAYQFSVENGGSHVRLVPKVPANSYNGLTVEGDSVLYFSAGTEGSGALCIVPWQGGVDTGIRINSDGKVSIGTNTTDYILNVQGTQLIKTETGGSTLYIRSTMTGSSGAPRIFFQRANGTEASPTAASAEDLLGTIGWLPHDGTQFATSNVALIAAVSKEAHTPSAKGTYIKFQTTPTGSTTAAERMRIDHNGNVAVGAIASPSYKLHVDGEIKGTNFYGDNIQYLKDVDSFEWFVRGTTTPDAYKIATLAAVAVGSYATVWIQASFSKAENLYHNLDVKFVNRNDFRYEASYTGTFDSNAGIRAYQNVDGTIDIWFYASQYYGAALKVFHSPRSGGGGSIITSPVTGTPTGTLVFDSADTTTYVIKNLNVALSAKRVAFGNSSGSGLSSDSNFTYDSSTDYLAVGTGTASTPLHTYHATDNTIATFESGDATVSIDLKDNTKTSRIESTAGGLYLYPDTTAATNYLYAFASAGATTLRIVGPGNGTLDCAALSLYDQDTNRRWGVMHRDGGYTYPNQLVLNYYNGTSWNTYPSLALETTGKIGVGTYTPATPLHVYHATDDTIATFESGDAGVELRLKDDTKTAVIKNDAGVLSLCPDLSASSNLMTLSYNTTNGTQMYVRGNGTTNAVEMIMVDTSNSKAWQFTHRDSAHTPANCLDIIHHNGSDWPVYMRMLNNGTILATAPDYETLVTSDDVVPNKKYVDDAIVNLAIAMAIALG